MILKKVGPEQAVNAPDSTGRTSATENQMYQSRTSAAFFSSAGSNMHSAGPAITDAPEPESSLAALELEGNQSIGDSKTLTWSDLKPGQILLEKSMEGGRCIQFAQSLNHCIPFAPTTGNANCIHAVVFVGFDEEGYPRAVDSSPEQNGVSRRRMPEGDYVVYAPVDRSLSEAATTIAQTMSNSDIGYSRYRAVQAALGIDLLRRPESNPANMTCGELVHAVYKHALADQNKDGAPTGFFSKKSKYVTPKDLGDHLQRESSFEIVGSFKCQYKRLLDFNSMNTYIIPPLQNIASDDGNVKHYEGV